MSREILLGALVTTAIQKMGNKFEFYGLDTGISKDLGWTSPESVTLEQFLAQHPIPEENEDVTIYGIAWEFIWGERPPKVVTEARQNLLTRAKTGMEISETEKLWLKIIAVDTDMF